MCRCGWTIYIIKLLSPRKINNACNIILDKNLGNNTYYLFVFYMPHTELPVSSLERPLFLASGPLPMLLLSLGKASEELLQHYPLTPTTPNPHPAQYTHIIKVKIVNWYARVSRQVPLAKGDYLPIRSLPLGLGIGKFWSLGSLGKQPSLKPAHPSGLTQTSLTPRGPPTTVPSSKSGPFTVICI